VTESFAELLRVMWSENFNFVSPMSFREAIVRFAPRFSGTDQQDSQEFLIFLLDGLHEDLNLALVYGKSINNATEDDPQFEKLPDWQASAISWEKYLYRNSSIIVSLFQGQYRSRLTCLSCKQVYHIHTLLPFYS
jgi:ubiquitin carboxyl-terminal hydrolase 8